MHKDNKNNETGKSSTMLNQMIHTVGNQIRVVAFDVLQLTQASLLQKNQMFQNVFRYLRR